ncbi:hypothetical protein [Smaragdicoccus niigatensis]|uniref:hypothetical protein n=1 Tax=Smaragdicoccus niigatensis TaxID=359359 RepID=UPI00036BA241|nr:hypothetical protein [Smaragdicoccus niigatensis]
MNPAILIAEWRKLWTIPVLRWVLFAPIAVGLLAGLAGGFAHNVQPALSAAWLTTMTVAVVVTTLGTGAEIRHRTIVSSQLTHGFPRLFTAKLIVAAGIGLAVGVVCAVTSTLGVFMAQQALNEPEHLAVVAGSGTIGTICWALAGVGLGLAIQRADFLLAGVLAWCFIVEPLLVAALAIVNGAAFVAGPAMSALALTGIQTMGQIDLLTIPVAVLSTVVWSGIAVGGGWWLARNRALV